jgi:type IV pilus assembly protein PilQ
MKDLAERIWPRRRGALPLVLVVLLTLLGVHTGAAAADPALKVRSVALEAAGTDSARVTVATSGEPQYVARVADGGMRLIIDLPSAEVAGAPGAITKGNRVVSGVMTQTFDDAGRKTTRLLVQLARPAAYKVWTDPGALHVELTAAEATAPAARGPASTRRAAEPAEVRASADSLRDVRFEHKGDRDRVVLDLGGAADYVESEPAPGLSRLELKGVRLPAALQRTLDASAYDGPVRSVSTFVRPADPTRVVVEIERRAGAKGFVAREGGALVYTFTEGPAPTSLSGVASDGGVARRTRTVAREAQAPDVPKVETSLSGGAPIEATSEPDEASGFLPTVVGQTRQRFSGRRINLDLKDADIHNVLRLLSDVGRVNIVTSDTVSGTVTIRVNNVPWDQALETVLQAKGLGMVRQGNMIRVALLSDLNKERELDLARRKSELQLAPLETRLIPVSYATASELQARAKDLLSPRGSIAVDERTNVLIARDVAGNLNQIEELLRELDTQTPQVLIEARIVEATSRYLRDVGIQWGGDATFSSATGNPTGLAFPANIGVVGGASDTQTPTAGLSPFATRVTNPNFAVNLPAVVGTGTGGAVGLTFGSINNSVNLAVRLSAAESSGMLRIISSPRILTLDNRKARIAQGTLIPFSQISAQGVQTTFQEAKLQLLVTPHVTAEGSVAMHVRINRDEPDFNQTSARGEPTILKREAETDLLILDGHTAVIGGIFTRNTGRNLDQVPLLGDIPILGVLFQRRRASDSRSELVIFLTPRIVNRAEALGR